MNEVFVVYEGDQWLSTDSMRVKAICTDKSYVIMVAEDILKEHGLKHEYEMTEVEEYEKSIEDCIEELERYDQCRCSDFSIDYELFALNEPPYSV